MNIGNVLSLFDGISCGQIALNRAGFTYDNYFASEIDKHAIKVTQTNYPNTIQLGDVTKISSNSLPEINILIGGSPCQGFSFAGKQLNFEDPRSKLFFEYVRLLKECQPKYFLLENVRMKKEYQDVISEYLGVKPILINSALVSAQNRQRLYWTNIKDIVLPQDKHIKLQNILDSGYADREKTFCCRAGGGLSGPSNYKRYFTKHFGQYKFNKNVENLSNDEKIEFMTPLSIEELEKCQTLPIGYTKTVSQHQRYRSIGNGWTVDVISHILSFIKK